MNMEPTFISKCTLVPHHKSTMGDLKLSVSDLPMLSCHYIQKGALFTLSTNQPLIDTFISNLKTSLSQTLSRFPPLSGRLITDSDGYIYITCNDFGVDFIHAEIKSLSVHDILSPAHVPHQVNSLFSFDRRVSYDGHENPLLAVQITELQDGVFVSCSMNHAVADGTSFWNFFNTFSAISRGVEDPKIYPDFSRDSLLISPAVLRFPDGPPKVTFNEEEPLSERIFSFSREAVLKLKTKLNNNNGSINAVELFGKQSNDTYETNYGKVTAILGNWFKKNTSPTEISSFQSLCVLLWRAVTRARNLDPLKTTTFRMAVNCRHRLNPKLDGNYFGNAIQSIPTYASVGDVLSRDLRWCAEQINNNVIGHNDATVRKFVENWEQNPTCFPLGNLDGASITMGSSPRFPMYDNDFGWGPPIAVRSGRANKFDGKISAFPGRKGGGDIDLEVVLAPLTLAGIECDEEFMQYVS